MSFRILGNFDVYACVCVCTYVQCVASLRELRVDVFTIVREQIDNIMYATLTKTHAEFPPRE
jgi:hypothetical protein